MKHTILLLALFLCAVCNMDAQDTTAVTIQKDSLESIHRNNYMKYDLSDGWFVGADFGAQTFFGYKSNKGPFSKRITPAFSFNFGKWITPDFGVRFAYNGSRIKGFTPNYTDFSTSSSANSKGGYPFKYKYNSVHFDVLLNFSEIFGRFKEQRTYNCIIFLGGGFNFVKPSDKCLGYIDEKKPLDHEFLTNIGIENDFYISKRVAITLNAEALCQRRIVNREATKGFLYVWDFMTPITAGIKVNMGNMYKQKGYSQEIAQEYVTIINENKAQKRIKEIPDSTNYDDSLRLQKRYFMPYKFGEGWFVSAGIGVQSYFGNKSRLGPIGDRLTPAYEFTVGKWFLPYAGCSFSYLGHKIKGFTDEQTIYTTNDTPNSKGGYAYKFYYHSVNFHFLLDLKKLFSQPRDRYVYTPILSFGAGVEKIKKNNGSDWSDNRVDNEFTLNIGIDNTFKISKHISVYAKAAAMLHRNRINVNYEFHNFKSKVNVILPVTVGIQINIGRHAPRIGYSSSFVKRLYKESENL